MHISIVIPTYNRSNYLRETLENALNQTMQISEYEVIVVDNNSNDDTKAVVEEYQKSYSNLKYLFEEEQGNSTARNTGYRNATSDYIFYIDDDITLDPNSVKNVIEYININPDVELIGGKLTIYYQDTKPEWITNKVEAWMGKNDYGDIEVPVTEENVRKKLVKYPIAGCYVIKKQILEKIGGFNPEIGIKGKIILAGEETLICKEILRNGGKVVYLPSVKGLHRLHPSKINREFLLGKTFSFGISDTFVQKTTEKDLIKHIKYFIFRVIFLAKNILDWLIAKLTMDSQKQFEARLLLNFNFGVLKAYLS